MCPHPQQLSFFFFLYLKTFSYVFVVFSNLKLSKYSSYFAIILFATYCLSKKSWPIYKLLVHKIGMILGHTVYSDSLYKNWQDFLDIQYSTSNEWPNLVEIDFSRVTKFTFFLHFIMEETKYMCYMYTLFIIYRYIKMDKTYRNLLELCFYLN